MEKKNLFWDSLIGEDLVSSSHASFQQLCVEGKNVFWTESRPLEQGRHALIKKEENRASFELFPHMSVQTKVHEYGGGSFCLKKECLIFFDAKTSSLYMQKKQEKPVCLMRDPLKRCADFCMSPDLSTVICVCEDHSNEQEIANYIIAIDLFTHEEKIVHQGYDFYASPRWSPDGTKIAFLTWNAPFMPWEECSLKVISWNFSKELFSIGSVKESVSQFIWIDDDEIIFASDRNGFSNLYRFTLEGEFLLCEKEADFSSPLWVLGRKNFEAFSWNGKECLIVTFSEKGVDFLAILERKSLKFQRLDLPYTVIRALDVGSLGIYFIGGTPKEPLSLVFLDANTLQCETLAPCFNNHKVLDSWISIPIEVYTESSLDHQKVFGLFYPPKNPCHNSETFPPLIIKCHSGPTAHSTALLAWDIQFWTSRGFAWLEVNYRGSSGFGRRYREALNYNWGLLDVQDCLDLAQFLVKNKQVDGKALFSKGSSAGGFTALCMAAVSLDIKGCISSYGVTDLLVLAQETHKFEKYYVKSLVGNEREFPCRYKARSPISRVGQISCPVLFLHGEKDSVVPLSQAEEMHKKLPLSELYVFKEEGHGFRKSDTIKKCLEIEMAFYTKILQKRGEIL